MAASACTHSPVAGDADRHDVVALGVGGGEHVAGGDPGDVVLGGLAAEQHDEAHPAGGGPGVEGVAGEEVIAATVVRAACARATATVPGRLDRRRHRRDGRARRRPVR